MADSAPDPFPELEREMAVLLRRARALSMELAREVHPGLEADAYGLLVRLDGSQGRRVTDLAADLGVGKPTISRQLALLEKLGLIERDTDAADGRAFVFSLSPDGRRRLRSVRTRRRQSFRKRLSSWEPEDVAALARLLGDFNTLI